MKIQEKVRGLLRSLLDDAGLSHRDVGEDDDRLTALFDEVDLVALFGFLAALQGTGCRAGVAAVAGGEFRLTVVLPDGWWRE